MSLLKKIKEYFKLPKINDYKAQSIWEWERELGVHYFGKYEGHSPSDIMSKEEFLNLKRLK